MTKTTTPWGPATLVEKVSLPQQAGDKHFSSVIELLEDQKGKRFIRVAYATGGAVRRGPVTFRARDLERLSRLLAKSPELAGVLGLDRGAA
jgi:hypothetical protein